MSRSSEPAKLSFWDHFDELRGKLVRIAAVTVLFGAVAFLFKEPLFAVILGPKNEDFITYRLFILLGEWLNMPSIIPDAFYVKLINTGLAQQFVIHMKMAIYAGLLLVSPYILYELFRFVVPALHSNERRYALRIVGGGYAMFMLGVALSYFLIFPLTFRFLGTYQVSSDVDNLISLDSYIDTLMMLNLMMGILFEIPILSWLFAKLGFLTSEFMKKYRKHAIVIILTVAAIITPTSDIFTLLLVGIPIYLLYEVSIIVVSKVGE